MKNLLITCTCSQLTPFVSHMHKLHTAILTFTFTHFTHYHTLQLPHLVFSLRPDPKVVSYTIWLKKGKKQNVWKTSEKRLKNVWKRLKNVWKRYHTINFVRLLIWCIGKEGGSLCVVCTKSSDMINSDRLTLIRILAYSLSFQGEV